MRASTAGEFAGLKIVTPAHNPLFCSGDAKPPVARFLGSGRFVYNRPEA